GVQTCALPIYALGYDGENYAMFLISCARAVGNPASENTTRMAAQAAPRPGNKKHRIIFAIVPERMPEESTDPPENIPHKCAAPMAEGLRPREVVPEIELVAPAFHGGELGVGDLVRGEAGAVGEGGGAGAAQDAGHERHIELIDRARGEELRAQAAAAFAQQRRNAAARQPCHEVLDGHALAAELRQLGHSA